MEDLGARQLIEQASVALVREYLNRKGCKRALQELEKKIPRDSESIGNKAELAHSLHIAPLIRKNKSLGVPYKTIIEILVWDLLKRHHKMVKEAETSSSKLLTRPSTAKAKFHTETKIITPAAEKLELKDVDFDSEDTFQKPLKYNQKATSTVHGVENFNEQLSTDDAAAPHSPRRHAATGRGQRAYTAPVMVSGLRISNSLTKHRTKKQPSSVVEMLSASPEKVILSQETLPAAERVGSAIPERRKSGDRQKHKKSSGKSATPEPSRTAAFRIDDALKNKDIGDVSVRDRTGVSVEKKVMKNGVIGKLRSDFSSPLDSQRKLKPDTVADILEDLDLPQDVSEDSSEVRCAQWLDRAIKTGSWSPTPIKIDTSELKMSLESKTSSREPSFNQRSRVSKSSRKVEFDIQAGQPIDFLVATQLRQLIFGSSSIRGFTEAWSNQSFSFCDCDYEKPDSLRFGMIQKKGGPCGLLAAVQAFVLKHLLFGKVGNLGSEIRQARPTALQASDGIRSSCLAEALIEIIWRASGDKAAVVASFSTNKSFVGFGTYKPDGLTEYVITNECKTLESLHQTIYTNIKQYEEGRGAAVLLLYSAILSRGIAEVITDMDEPTNTLMGAHGYCTQEMVNLLTVGYAASNVFNGQTSLDGGTILRGVRSRGEVGLLSLFEYYNSCKVGSFLKTPKYPIWIVCSESHFSILFCLNCDLISDWTAERLFHLYYYDGLARQDEEIKLTVHSMAHDQPQRGPDDLIPPLELCIQTKWPDAFVDWNGVEPIL